MAAASSSVVLYGANDAAKLVGVSRPHLHTICARAGLKPARVSSGKYLFTPEDVALLREFHATNRRRPGRPRKARS